MPVCRSNGRSFYLTVSLEAASFVVGDMLVVNGSMAYIIVLIISLPIVPPTGFWNLEYRNNGRIQGIFSFNLVCLCIDHFASLYHAFVASKLVVYDTIYFYIKPGAES